MDPRMPASSLIGNTYAANTTPPQTPTDGQSLAPIQLEERSSQRTSVAHTKRRPYRRQECPVYAGNTGFESRCGAPPVHGVRPRPAARQQSTVNECPHKDGDHREP